MVSQGYLMYFTVLALCCFILECKICLIPLKRERFNFTWFIYFPSLFLFKLCLLVFFPFHYWCCLLTSWTVQCFVLYHDFSMVHTRIRSTQSVLLSDRVELLVKKDFYCLFCQVRNLSDPLVSEVNTFL